MYRLTLVSIVEYPSGEGLWFSHRPIESNQDEWAVVEKRGTLYFASKCEAKDLERYGFRTPKADMLDAYRLWRERIEIVVDEFVHKVENVAALRELWGQLNFRIERALSQLN